MKWLRQNWYIPLVAVLGIALGGWGAVVAYNQQKPVVELVAQAQTRTEAISSSQIVTLTNEYRLSKGLSLLTENPLLDQSACLKAEDMVANSYWAHTSPSGVEPWHWFQQVGYQYAKAGENLAYGFKSSDEVIVAWENSPEHEVNLSGEYTQVGVCVKMHITIADSADRSLIVAHYGTPR